MSGSIDKRNNYFFVSMVSFFMNIAAGVVASILPLQMDSMGAGNAYLGKVRNLFEALSHFVKLAVGYISDKIKNRKLFLIIGYGGPLLEKLFFILSFRPRSSAQEKRYYYGIGQAIGRFLDSVRDIPRDAVVYDSISAPQKTDQKSDAQFLLEKKEQKNSMYMAHGFRKAMGCLGSVIGGLISSLILYSGSLKAKRLHIEFKPMDYFFYFSWFLFLPVICAVLTLFFGVRDLFNEREKIKSKDSNERDPFALFLLHAKKMKAFFILLSITFLFSLGKYSDAFFLKILQKDLAPHFVPISFSLYYALLGIFAIICSKISQKTKSAWFLGSAFFILFFFNILMFLSADRTYFHTIICLVLYSFQSSVMTSSLSAVIQSNIPFSAIFATCLGILSVTNAIGGLITTCVISYLEKKAIGSNVLGFFVKKANVSGVFQGFFKYCAVHFIPSNMMYLIAIVPSFIACFIFLCYRKEISDAC